MASLLESHTEYLSILEDLARRLLQVRFNSVQELWQIEVDLVRFQVRLQEAIAEERKLQDDLKDKLRAKIAQTAAPKEEHWKTEIQELQEELKLSKERILVHDYAYYLSRRLGDSFAWVLMRGNRRKIEPLTKNMRIPTSRGHGLRGMLAIAEVLMNAGAGFPILHDATESLRVGDITFYFPNAEPLTIEVKTHLESQSERGAMLRIEVIGLLEPERWEAINARMPHSVVVPSDSVPDEQSDHMNDRSPIDRLPGRSKRKRPDKRLTRQLHRMREAKVWQTAVPGKPFQIGEQQALLMNLESEHSVYHWDIVHELAMKAKTEGYASRVVDDAYIYIALYADPPLFYPFSHEVEIPHAAELVRDVTTSGILYPDATKNRLWLGGTSMALTDAGPLNAPPLFCYPLPLELVFDILHGRLVITVIANLGNLVAALQAEGFNTRLPSSEEEFNRAFFPVSTELILPDGSEIRVEMQGIWYYGVQIMSEFLSVDGFVGLIRGMAEAARHTVQDKAGDGAGDREVANEEDASA